MRLAVLALALLAFATPAFAQSSPCSQQSFATLAFDPYKPSDLAIVRNYGGTVLAQAPLSALLRLDPYVPSQGELLRQLGRAIPWWPYPGYAWYPPVHQSSPCVTVAETQRLPLTTFSEMMAELQQQAPVRAATPTATPSKRIPGITIRYDGRLWGSAGPAVPFNEAEFERVGQGVQSPIFRRAAGDRDVIYIPTTPGMVAPFRVVR